MPVVTRTTRSTASKPPPDQFQITTRQKENLTTEAQSAQRLETKIRFSDLGSTGPRLDVAYWHRSATFRVCPKLIVFAMTQISC